MTHGTTPQRDKPPASYKEIFQRAQKRRDENRRILEGRVPDQSDVEAPPSREEALDE